MPDGQWLYRVGRAATGGGVQLLNLAAASVESVDLSIPPPYEVGQLPDRHELIVLSASTGQVAIVDLLDRGIEPV